MYPSFSMPVSHIEIEGYIQCEKLALLDLSIRGHKKIGRISMPEVVNVSDAIQGIFDYV